MTYVNTKTQNYIFFVVQDLSTKCHFQRPVSKKEIKEKRKRKKLWLILVGMSIHVDLQTRPMFKFKQKDILQIISLERTLQKKDVKLLKYKVSFSIWFSLFQVLWKKVTAQKLKKTYFFASSASFKFFVEKFVSSTELTCFRIFFRIYTHHALHVSRCSFPKLRNKSKLVDQS